MKKKTAKESVFIKLGYVFVALMLTVFLFWFDKTGFEGITEAKLSAFRWLCGGYVLANLVLVPACLVTGLIKAQNIKRFFTELTAAQKLCLVFLLITLVSLLASPYRGEAWQGVSRYEGALTIGIYALCFFFLSSFGRVKKWMAYLLGASVLAFSAICILQLYGLDPFGLYPEGLNYFGADVDYNGAYLGTIGNTDLVAAFLCIVIPILWVSVLRLSGKYKYLLLLPLAAALFVLFKMYVLAGFVGVLGGAVLSLPMALKLSDRRAKLLAVVLVCLLLLALACVFFFDFEMGIFHEAHELLHGRVQEGFGSGRIYIWKNVLERVPERLWLGHGPDTMRYSGIEAFTRYDPVKNVQIVAEIDAAHNEYLNILYHQGIIALLVYLAMLGVLAAGWIKNGRKDTACAALGTAALCYCVQAFFGISMLITAPFFWMTLGLLDASLHRE